MGALTLKTFPFELRGWDIEKFESIDPTDGFGSNTRVYISKNSVVQIEPDYDVFTYNTWITDKGRQFFDGAFGVWKSGQPSKGELMSDILNSMVKTLFILDHCNAQKKLNNFLTIVFENVSLEVLSMLILVSQRYSFVKLRRAENFNINNDLESNYQLNSASNRTKLHYSTLCLLISTNPRYEGFYLNLNLRQRYRKGNFKCLMLGSLMHLTFPITLLGSNLAIVKAISEGNHLVCQDFKFSKNPVIIVNHEMFKRQDSKTVFNLLKTLNYNNNYSGVRNGLSALAPSLSEPGNQALAKFQSLTAKDFADSNLLYLINTTANSVPNLKKVITLKSIRDIGTKTSHANNHKLILDQNSINHKNQSIYKELQVTENSNYYYLPSSIFYENEETFINTEGFFKRTTKLISQKKTKSNWQTLRKLFKHFKNKLSFLNLKDNLVLSYNVKKMTTFKNYINFQFYATQTLNSLSFYSSTRNQYFNFYGDKFKQKSSKMLPTKLKYWLDDFFTGGKDEYSQKSLILSNCSRILRSESTNFF